ncbi:unnamed protein product [Heligmosomoides polygyrus]|uniref:Uncharacterized protein n=1 Tax=Heligmosomoides polygyrus TaxID=6339 RepID=A0A183G284_HELPZ|nr:unnamed protein product [Heligmosomoides polygyrus]
MQNVLDLGPAGSRQHVLDRFTWCCSRERPNLAAARVATPTDPASSSSPGTTPEYRSDLTGSPTLVLLEACPPCLSSSLGGRGSMKFQNHAISIDMMRRHRHRHASTELR